MHPSVASSLAMTKAIFRGSKTLKDNGWSIKNRHQRRSLVWVLVRLVLGRVCASGSNYENTN